MGICPSKRMRRFLLWTLVTCMLLGIQKMMYEGTPINLTSVEYFNKPKPQYDDPTMNELVRSPFVTGQPKFVVILSYQRSGSTFLGQWVNSNPEIFYNFEPVDALYSAMYGTNLNANVPSDITNFPNGSIRILPKEEIAAVSDYLRQFLFCDLDSLPTQSLLSFYFLDSYEQFLAAKPYTDCIRSKFLSRYRICEPHVQRFCGKRFGEVSETIQKACYRTLWLNELLPKDKTSHSSQHDFKKYGTCINNLRIHLNATCQNFLQEVCQNHFIRVIKVVRATMESMEKLLENIENFRVIHLVRDPRAVALSRKLFVGNVRGTYSGNNSETILREAKLYCSTVVRDITVRKKLERKYPGKIYSLIYDKMVKNTTRYLENVFQFLNESPSQETLQWMAEKDTEKYQRTSEEIAKEWENVITVKMNKDILANCKDFYNLVEYEWTYLLPEV